MQTVSKRCPRLRCSVTGSPLVKTLLHEAAIRLTRKNRTTITFLFMGGQVVFVLDMVADADADEVGFDVVGSEGDGGKQVVVEIVTRRYLLVKQHPEGWGVERHVVAQPHVEHEAGLVEQHLVRD